MAHYGQLSDPEPYWPWGPSARHPPAAWGLLPVPPEEGLQGGHPAPPHTQVHTPADRAPPQVKPPPASPLPT